MPPEREIEKLLRAFARRRRQQAGEPPVLHPATRRLLQDEVARQYGRPAAAGTRGGPVWLRFWPRLAWATATVSVVMVGLLFFEVSRQKQPQISLAATDSSETREIAPAQPPAAAPPAVARADGSAAGFPAAPPSETERLLAARAERPPTGQGALLAARPARGEAAEGFAGRAVAPAPASTAVTEKPATASETLAFGVRSADSRHGATESGSQPLARMQSDRAGQATRAGSEAVTWVAKSATTPTVSAPGTAEQVAPAGLSEGRTEAAGGTQAVLVRRFSQAVSPPEAGSITNHPWQWVLNSFQLEQQGQNIRIVDRDGSVYTGSVEWAAVALPSATTARPTKDAYSRGAVRPASRAEARTTAQSLGAEDQPVSFTVRGTNATLRQLVTFTGNVQALPAANAAGQAGQAVVQQARSYPQQAQQAQTQQSQSVLMQNSRLSGRARLADGREWDVEATPAP